MPKDILRFFFLEIAQLRAGNIEFSGFRIEVL